MPNVFWQLPVFVVLPVISSTRAVNDHLRLIVWVQSFVAVNPRVFCAIKVREELLLLLKLLEKNRTGTWAFQRVRFSHIFPFNFLLLPRHFFLIFLLEAFFFFYFYLFFDIFRVNKHHSEWIILRDSQLSLEPFFHLFRALFPIRALLPDRANRLRIWVHLFELLM